jgi:hypothetical protein
VVGTERLAEYVEIVERSGMAGYRRPPGNLGDQLLTRDLGEGRSELITPSWWVDLDHIRRFAGSDIGVAGYYPRMRSSCSSRSSRSPITTSPRRRLRVARRSD